MARERARTRIRSELKNTAYEIFIGALSILSIANLVLMLVFASDPSLQLVLSVMNALFSGIFLGDFLFRIFTAPSAAHYFFRGFGWADLLASLPFAQLKVLRIFRLIRVFRLLRDLGPRTLWSTLIHDRANSALMTLLLLGILVLQFGSLSILAVEGKADGANITSASDALWYTVVTISTVGYGDQYPVTNAGRLIGVLIIVVGVGIFGTFTGYLANLFLGPSKPAEPEDGATDAEAPGATQATATTEAEAVTATTEAEDPAGMPQPAAAASVAPGASLADESAERLRVLLAQSEETMAEIRQLLADAKR
ncbi:ion transporter [Microbacterium cremeum]|uniref:ion transporter n=1 Tax=Microbacterium cremeum TaxID=2782169 RepID=UPI001888DDF7|nr:ion transporter [Microbacterium cremeum]